MQCGGCFSLRGTRVAARGELRASLVVFQRGSDKMMEK